MMDFLNSSVLDDFGRLTVPIPDDDTKYNFREIKEYCNKNDKHISDLTEDELEKFIVN